MDDDFWMTRALLIAKKALSLNEIPIGAILVYDNFELASASNLYCSDFFHHAEVILISKSVCYFSDNIIDESILYVTLEPCIKCVSLLSSFKIKKIVFSAYNSEKLRKNSVEKINIKGGLLLNDSKFLIQTFFIKKRCISNKNFF